MKKIVHYKPHPDDIIKEGHNAYIWQPLDHPQPCIIKPEPLITAKVEQIHEGYFETENTIYARAHFNGC